MNNKALTVILGLVVLGGGYGLGRLATRDKDGSSPAAAGSRRPRARATASTVSAFRSKGPPRGRRTPR